MNTSLDKIIKNNHYESGIEVCPGCENHCTVKTFRFDGGRTFHSGNQCERIYGSDAEAGTKGVNMFVEKTACYGTAPPSLSCLTDSVLCPLGFP